MEWSGYARVFWFWCREDVVMPDWLAVVLAIVVPLLSFAGTLIGVAFITGGRFAKLEEQSKGQQAQLDRHDRQHAECDGKIGAMRQEYDGRFERAASKAAAGEQAQAGQNSALVAALTEIRATMAAMKEALDRLSEAERERHRAQPQAAPSLIDRLQEFAALQKMLKGAA